jgi:adenylyltransferase/sulfurtransferase
MRYARQTILPEIGAEGQKHLSAAKVLCIGAGGLGSAALPYLAAAGIGTIGICDDDVVELSNLQRQVLFDTADTGKKKATRAAEALAALNPETNLVAHDVRLSAENALQLFAQYEIIMDGSDNFPTKFLINDAAVKLRKPWVYGAVLSFAAQVTSFTPNGPCYRCLYSEPPSSHVQNCAEAGVLGAVVGVAGTMQAVEVLKLAVKSPALPPLNGRLLTLDAHDWQWRSYAVERNPACPICSKNPEEVRLTMTNTTCATDAVPEITVQEAATLKNAVFVDVREPHEWDEGHVPDATHIPLGTLLENTAPELPRDTQMVVYCRGGTRSKRALQYLQTLGFTNGKNLVGGFMAWSREVPERCSKVA